MRARAMAMAMARAVAAAIATARQAFARRARLALGVGALGLAGCALTSKAPPAELHYFSPQPGPLHGRSDAAAPAVAPAPDAPRLRLAPVTASAYLRYRIVHRDSPVAIEPYETLRWTEPPHDYARRALAGALFDSGALVEAVGGAAPALDVELTAFEERIRPTGRAGRVALHYELRDDARVIARGEVAAERPAQGPGIEAVVVAIGAALDAAAAELAGRVVPELRERAGPSPPPSEAATRADASSRPAPASGRP